MAIILIPKLTGKSVKKYRGFDFLLLTLLMLFGRLDLAKTS